MRIAGLLVAAGLALAASAPLSAQSSATLTPRHSPNVRQWDGDRVAIFIVFRLQWLIVLIQGFAPHGLERELRKLISVAVGYKLTCIS